jgi:hypothetical protein
MLARQVLHHLSHSTSPFSSGYFRDMVLIFAWANLGHDPHILGFLIAWDVRHMPPHPGIG